MDKRFFLAILLTALVVILTPKIFPTPPRPPAPRTTVTTPDSSSATPAPTASAAASTPAPTVGTAPTPGAPSSGATPTPLTARADTVTVATPTVTYRLSTVGAAIQGAALHDYRALNRKGGNSVGNVELVRPGRPLVELRLLSGRDTVALDQMTFAVDSAPGSGRGTAPITFRTTTPSGETVAITYTFPRDSSYAVRVSGEVRGPNAQGSSLLVRLPAGLRSEEADTLDDQRNLAYVLKPERNDAESIPFDKLDATERRVLPGPFTWVASKNKYFLAAVLTPAGQPSFSRALIAGAPRTGKIAVNASAEVERPLDANGRFALDLYAGPQAYDRLLAQGRDLVHANPYGGWLRAIVQPVAGIVIRVLLWMHTTLKLSYGWVLVIFAIVIRLALWPLNQRAMRSSLKMQRIQPELQAIQKKYKSAPEKQQAEMMKIYQAHGMSPFSMFGGCLPVLLPWPVLMTLYFVFQNTIEFRGVSFLYLHDISQKDPFYILPLLMAASMFVLSWIGLRNSPPNPQAKTMAYVMPAMMVVLFLNFASGLNLYYFVQNLAALPQQWLIARERAKASPVVQT